MFTNTNFIDWDAQNGNAGAGAGAGNGNSNGNNTGNGNGNGNGGAGNRNHSHSSSISLDLDGQSTAAATPAPETSGPDALASGELGSFDFNIGMSSWFLNHLSIYAFVYSVLNLVFSIFRYTPSPAIGVQQVVLFRFSRRFAFLLNLYSVSCFESSAHHTSTTLLGLIELLPFCDRPIAMGQLHKKMTRRPCFFSWVRSGLANCPFCFRLAHPRTCTLHRSSYPLPFRKSQGGICSSRICVYIRACVFTSKGGWPKYDRGQFRV